MASVLLMMLLWPGWAFSDSKAIKLDMSLIQRWDKNSSYPCAPPFTATYSRSGKTLVFVAAGHAFGAVEESDPRLALVRQEIEKFKPEGIVVERPVQNESFQGKLNIEDADEKCHRKQNSSDESRMFTCGEPTYAAIAASKLGATVYGGEKDFGEVRDEYLYSRAIDFRNGRRHD